MRTRPRQYNYDKIFEQVIYGYQNPELVATTNECSYTTVYNVVKSALKEDGIQLRYFDMPSIRKLYNERLTRQTRKG